MNPWIIRLSITCIRYYPKFQSFKVSRFQDFKIPWSIPRFQASKMSKLQSFEVSKFRSFKVSRLQNFTSSQYQIQKIKKTLEHICPGMFVFEILRFHKSIFPSLVRDFLELFLRSMLCWVHCVPQESGRVQGGS